MGGYFVTFIVCMHQMAPVSRNILIIYSHFSSIVLVASESLLLGSFEVASVEENSV